MQLTAVSLVALLLATLVAAAPPDKYSSRFDNADIDSVLKSERALAGYMKCVLDTGPCTAEGRELRKNIPEALRTSCAKCTDRQKAIVRKLSLHVKKHHPDQWQLISNKYDPERRYHDSFQKFLTAAA